MTHPMHIDWPVLLADIAHLLGEPTIDGRGRVTAGTRAVAEYLRVNRSTLLRWQDGSEPRHSDGEQLLIAWCRLTGKNELFAPRNRPVLSAAKMR